MAFTRGSEYGEYTTDKLGFQTFELFAVWHIAETSKVCAIRPKNGTEKN
jgi:hypothetical protein